MALGITAYSEAPFGAENDADVIAYPLGVPLSFQVGNSDIVGTGSVDVTGSQATITNGVAVAGSSALVSTTGISLQTFIGEEDINVGVPVTGIQLSITNKTSTQDTLTAFGEAPFATLSPTTFFIPSVEVFTTTGAGQLPSFLLQSSVGAVDISADGNVSVNVAEHTINTSVGDVDITGIANVSVTGSQMNMSIGEESAFTDIDVSVTGTSLTIFIGEEDAGGNANVSVTGTSLTSTIGDVSLIGNANISLTGISGTLTLGTPTITPNSLIDVTGNQLSTFVGQAEADDASAEVTGVSATMSIGFVNITAWQQINPGVSNVWTEVDKAA
jgi:trimeric autotransporter adhesin